MKDGISIGEVRAGLGVIAARLDQIQPGRATTLKIEKPTLAAAPQMRTLVLSVGGVILSAVVLVRAPHQLLDESRAGIFGLANDNRRHFIRNLQSTGVKTDELSSPVFIRQRELNRLVDAARTRSQGGFQPCRRVGGQD